MMTATTPLIIVLTSVSLYGSGVVARRLTRGPDMPWPATIGVGLAAVVVLGGFVNLIRIAFAPTLWIIVVAGLAMFVLRAAS